MASTYSNIKIQLMASGENNTTWGNVTNTNLGTALEEAIVGSADVTFASGNVTLTLTDTNASQTARHMRLRCTGTTGGSTRNLVVPSIEKPYIVANDCADSILVKTAAGTGITVPAGKTMWVYSDGTNVVNVTTHLSSLTLGTPLPISSGGTGSSAALTQGSVVFAGAGGAYSQDNANFFWDDTNNQLGIGTATPTYKIEARTDAVSGFNWISSFNNTATGSYGAGFLARSSVGSAYLYMRGDGLAYVENSTNNALGFATNATEKMRITAAGDVGIGTSSPSVRLHVDSGGFDEVIRMAGTGSPYASWYVGGTRRGYTLAQSTSFGVFSDTGIPLLLGTNGAERMRITSAGDVGVGVVPTAKLHVAGTIQSSSGSTTAQMYADGSAAYFASVGAFPSIFLTNSAERMRITAGGNVLVGTTTENWYPNAAALRLKTGSVWAYDASANNQLELDANLYQSTLGTYNFANTGIATQLRLIEGEFFFNRSSTSGTAGASATMNTVVKITAAADVGIGTSTPSARLEVARTDAAAGIRVTVGSGAYSGQVALFGVTGVSNGYYITKDASNNIQHIWDGTGGLERMRLDSSGNLGLGTAPSGVRLDVNGNIRTTLGSGGTLSLFEANAVRANQLFAGADASGSFINATFSTGGTATLRLETANNEHMRINGAGNVGIGTISPATRLHVAGITRISDATNSTAVNIDASTTAGVTSIIAQFGGSQLAFGAAGVENFRITSTGGITSSNLADAVGYKGLPQNSQTSGYTLALSDMGKHISITTGGVTIPANGAVAFPIGAAITIFNNSGTPQNIGITTDMLRQAGTANTGSRTLAQYGVATVLKVTSTVWVISGAGLS